MRETWEQWLRPQTMGEPALCGKCVVVGVSAAGKTCMVPSYGTNASAAAKDPPSAMGGWSGNFTVDGKTANLGLWDLTSSAACASLRTAQYYNTAGNRF